MHLLKTCTEEEPATFPTPFHIEYRGISGKTLQTYRQFVVSLERRVKSMDQDCLCGNLGGVFRRRHIESVILLLEILQEHVLRCDGSKGPTFKPLKDQYPHAPCTAATWRMTNRNSLRHMLLGILPGQGRAHYRIRQHRWIIRILLPGLLKSRLGLFQPAHVQFRDGLTDEALRRRRRRRLC